MRFWCDYCERDFDSEPESDELEQANCPFCDHSCLSFDNEYEEAKNRVAHGDMASTLLPGFIGAWFSFFGQTNRPLAHRSNTPAIIQYAARIQYRRVVIVTLPSLDQATEAIELLTTRNIVSSISATNEGHSVLVEDSDQELASRFIGNWLNENRVQ